MTRARKNRREEILAAAVRLVARQGVSGSTIRQITSEAGVTEGALYRHFESKDDLCRQAYRQIVEEMAGEKERIYSSAATVAAKLRDWIRVSYEFFDRYPAAFTYVLLTDHDFPESDITVRQGRLLTRLLAEAASAGELHLADPAVAMSHFTGVMLNIPRLINDGVLPPPATRYTADSVGAVCAIFGLKAPAVKD